MRQCFPIRMHERWPMDMIPVVVGERFAPGDGESLEMLDSVEDSALLFADQCISIDEQMELYFGGRRVQMLLYMVYQPISIYGRLVSHHRTVDTRKDCCIGLLRRKWHQLGRSLNSVCLVHHVRVE